MKTAIIYGSTTGNTETAARDLAQALAELSPEVCDVAGMEPEALKEWDVLILGVPTWNIGELQQDWEEFVGKVGGLDLKGKRVAIFGCGDEVGYADTFADGHGLLWEALEPSGAELIGLWPAEDYDFQESKGMRDGKFIGLVLDNDNHMEKSPERIKAWAEQLRAELAAAPVKSAL